MDLLLGKVRTAEKANVYPSKFSGEQKVRGDRPCPSHEFRSNF